MVDKRCNSEAAGVGDLRRSGCSMFHVSCAKQEDEFVSHRPAALDDTIVRSNNAT